ncbi:transcription elongation factor B polypeptide 3 [Anopheles ziemanni]|uniref:transcription elongation factor B polypeptide 3 n=2 Tax=coustani group TaxID=59130 RepID=UPI00265847F6|nr:transcription elongation factor B polypeptide 3 isoform X1 [Anopheles coustani]XP_058171941.1 transcription elongation factor B polypeptide 3 [Anopheles ziemanni]
MSSIEDVINHYQTSINKSLNDTARIVHCIGKLYKLPISVRHLQETGIGRTVNSLRKYDGEVGVAAKALVTKWKAMVAAEESDDGATGSGQQHGPTDTGTRHNGDRSNRSDMSDDEEDGADGDGDGGGHDNTMADEDDVHDYDVTNGSNGAEEDETYGESQSRDGHRDGQSNSESANESDDQTNRHHQDNHHQNHHHHHHSKSSEVKASSGHRNEHHSRSSGIKDHQSSGSSNHHNHHSSTSKQSSSTSSGSGSHKHASVSKSDSDHRRHTSSGDSKSHKSSSSRGDGSSRSSSSQGERHRERSFSKHHTNSSGTKETTAGGGSSGSSHSHSNSSSTRKESSHKDNRHHRSKDGEKSTGSSKRHAQEGEDGGELMTSSSSKRSRKEHRTEQGSSTSAESPSSSHSKRSSKITSSTSSASSSSKHRDRHEKSDERHSEKAGGSSKPKRKEKVPCSSQEEGNEESDPEDVADGLDGSGGASFADALAMIGFPGSKKKSSGSSKEKEKVTITKRSPSSTSSSSGGHSSRAKLGGGPSSIGSSSSRREGVSTIPSASELLSQKIKLEPLPEASEIVEALPMISPNYRPMPLNQTVMDCVFMGGRGSGGGAGGQRRPLTEEEALGQSMQSKNLRTKVYSGMKTNAKGVIPTLYELCIRLLQDHLDEIGATGGIPFYILKPVLERANPNQLLHLEHFNPHFVEDSDVLWEQHCKRTFRAKQRNEEELETWREMFLRCSEERDAKLKSLTQNIKLAQEQAAAPIRKTQLAYVDSAVKPPRSVINKQARYGTARAPVVSPAARVAALAQGGNVAQVGDTRLRVTPGARDNAQAQVFQPTKPRKAPMMAKVLSSMKGFKTSFRR